MLLHRVKEDPSRRGPLKMYPTMYKTKIFNSSQNAFKRKQKQSILWLKGKTNELRYASNLEVISK